MAKRTPTIAKQIEAGNEADFLAFVTGMLAEAGVRDPRRAQARKYPFESVMTIMVLGMMAGNEDCEGMAMYAAYNAAWLLTWLALPKKVPSAGVLRYVISRIDRDCLAQILDAWYAQVSATTTGASHIAIDGKSLRSSVNHIKGTRCLHGVNVYDVGREMVVGHQIVDQKKNEITTIPEQLAALDLTNTTVTMDAMGCQRDLAQQIVEQEGYYLLTIKNNQEGLRNALIDRFETTPMHKMDSHETVEKGHGRIEERTIHLCRDVNDCPHAEKWANLSFVARLVRKRTTMHRGKEETSTETSYVIGSHPDASADTILDQVRKHWAIENKVHYTLDMAFNEDRAAHWARNGAANMATLRRFVLNIIRLMPNRPAGIKTMRRAAGWSPESMMKTMQSALLSCPFGAANPAV